RLAVLVEFVLRTTVPERADRLGLTAEELNAPLHGDAAGSREVYAVHKGEALFPRIDVAKEIAYLEALDAEKKAAAEAAKAAEEAKNAPAETAGITDHEPEIDYDTFTKVEKIGRAHV